MTGVIYIRVGDNSGITAVIGGDEHKMLDTSGDFQYAVRGGEPVADPGGSPADSPSPTSG
jgi:hypothetical protein